MFLFLLESPLLYNEDDIWLMPQKLYLASYHRNGEIVSFAPQDRPQVDKEHCMAEFMNNSIAHQYTFFLLFSGERQYGLLALDIDAADFGFFYVISLQLGLVFRYQEARRLASTHMLEMSEHMEMMRQENLALDILSGYDNLTGLLNRRGFMEHLGMMRPKQGSKHAYMVYGDLDHLKEINDTWGHPEGDYAIHAAGQILKNALRDSDILGRIGGDEFIAFVFSDSESFIDTFRQRVTTACQQLNDISGKPYYVEISLGITAFDFTANTDIQEVISRTDTLLYESKKFRRLSIRKVVPSDAPVNWPTYSGSES
jgi:diguanylate cyclase (GGDEF)-like protein